MYSILFGMLSRTLIPLVLGVLLHAKVPVLAEGGMIFYLLVFYLLTLALETALLLAQITSHSSRNSI
jgi:hypothetical protein